VLGCISSAQEKSNFLEIFIVLKMRYEGLKVCDVILCIVLSL
jgi:hypothetical protein